MKNKSALTWMLCMVLLFSVVLSACSGNGEKNKTTNTPSNNTATDAPTDDAAKPATEEKHEPVTIKLISWSDSYTELYKMFNEKYPWITIEQVPVNGKPIMEIIATLEAAGTPADLTWIDSDLISFDQAGLVEDLTPYIEKDMTFQDVQLPQGFLIR